MNKNFQYMLFFGSLRKNSSKGYNFDRFGVGSQEYIKDIELDNFTMFSLGAYPAICRGVGRIKCELHKVGLLASQYIDRMEIGAGYKPIKIRIDDIVSDGTYATLYTMDKKALTGYPKVESGDWN